MAELIKQIAETPEERTEMIISGFKRKKARQEYMENVRVKWEALDPATHKSRIDNIMEALYLKSLKGDVKAAELILKRLYGKEREHIDINLNRGEDNYAIIQVNDIDSKLQELERQKLLLEQGSNEVFVNSGNNILRARQVRQQQRASQEIIDNADNIREGNPNELD